jgi:hypothetical protein
VTQAVPTAVIPVHPRSEFGDGTWIVGSDIEPGTYRSNGATDGVVDYCSYSRLKEPSSDSDGLSFGSANANEPIVIDIRPTDGAFKVSGCDTFRKAG